MTFKFDLSHYLKSPLVSLKAKVYLLRSHLTKSEIKALDFKISEMVTRIEIVEDYFNLSNLDFPLLLHSIASSDLILKFQNISSQINFNSTLPKSLIINTDVIRLQNCFLCYFRLLSKFDLLPTTVNLSTQSQILHIDWDQRPDLSVPSVEQEYIQTAILRLSGHLKTFANWQLPV